MALRSIDLDLSPVSAQVQVAAARTGGDLLARGVT